MSRRIFEQPTIEYSSLIGGTDFNVAVGKAGQVTKNITKAVFLQWLNGALNFANLTFSNVINKTAARANLSVYSASEVDTALGLKAAKTEVLTKTNVTSFAPTANYHPATKLYVDNKVQLISTGLGHDESSALQLTCLDAPMNFYNIFAASGANNVKLPATAGMEYGRVIIVHSDNSSTEALYVWGAYDGNVDAIGASGGKMYVNSSSGWIDTGLQ
jgi:hypothetical protein